MLAYDQVSNAYHEVGDTDDLTGYDGYGAPPDAAEGRVVYDGLGNPIGFAPFVAALAPFAVKAAAPLLKRLLPKARKRLAPLSRNLSPLVQQLLPSIVAALRPRARVTVRRAELRGAGLAAGGDEPPILNDAETMGDVVYDGLGNPVGVLPRNRRIARQIRQRRRLYPTGVPGYGPQVVPPGWMRPQLPYAGPVPRHQYMRCAVWPGQPGLVPAAATSALAPFTPIPPQLRRFRRRRARIRRR